MTFTDGQVKLGRVAKFKRPCVLDNQKMSEDNQKLRPGCPPDYQIFCERIDIIFSYLSLTKKKQYEN